MSALCFLALCLLASPVPWAYRRITAPAFSRLAPSAVVAGGPSGPDARRGPKALAAGLRATATPLGARVRTPSAATPADPRLGDHPDVAGPPLRSGRRARSAHRRPSHRSVPRDGGMATAEYAVMIVVACGFAIILFGVLHSAAVRDLLASIVRHALTQSI